VNDLFEYSAREASRVTQPLAERMRPKRIEDFVGQRDTLGEGRLVRQAID